MNNYLIYIIESNVSLLVLYLIFKALLSKKSNFSFNRFFILGTILASSIIPLISFPVSDISQSLYIQLAPITVYANPITKTIVSNFDLFFWVKNIYLFITSILLLNFIKQLLTIKGLKNKTKQLKSPFDQQTIYVGDLDNFSFFKWIFINEKDLQNPAIYLHEKQHVKSWHSLDIILVKLLQIIFWFNPIPYLFEKEIRLQHEYLVDAKVLQIMPKTSNYRQLLLNQLFNTEFELMTNNFNQKYLKNRLMMMTKGNKKEISKVIRFALMSMVILSPFIISCSLESEEVSEDEIQIEVSVNADEEGVTEVTVVEKNEVVVAKNESQKFLVVEEMPIFIGGEKAMYSYIAQNINYPEKAKIAGISGRVFVSFVVEKDGSISEVELLRGIGSGCDEEAIRVIESMPKWKAGKQHGKEVRVQYRMPIKFVLD